jgi:hypothetical protein
MTRQLVHSRNSFASPGYGQLVEVRVSVTTRDWLLAIPPQSAAIVEVAESQVPTQPLCCTVPKSRIALTCGARSRNRLSKGAQATRVVRRLRAYGVPEERIPHTGFPPHSLLGGPQLPTLRATLATRLARLDPEDTFRSHYKDEVHHFLGALPTEAPGATHLVFAVGGAGAQA